MKQAVKYFKIFLNLFVAVLVIVFIFYVFPKILIFFMPFVIGWIIAMIANPLVRFLERRVKILRKHSSMIIIITVLAGVILLGYLGVVHLVEQGKNLVHNLPDIYSSLQDDFVDIEKNLQVIYEKLPIDMQDSISEVTENFTSYLGDLVQAVGMPTFAAAGNFAKNVPGTLIAIIMAILSAYFFTAQHDQILKSMKKYTSSGIQERILFVFDDLKRVVGGYFKAQLKIMVVVYVLLVIGLFILKVDFVLLMAFLIAFLDMLPFFGTGTVLVPWAIFKFLSGDYTFAIGLIVIYVVTQLVRQVIQPKIVGDSIGMDPLAALFFMYIGYKFSGIGGMIIAVPIGMILINLYKAGIFDTQIRCVKELVNDINKFRKL